MCGRMTITEPERIVRKFKADVNKATLDKPRFNIAPSQIVPALIARDEQHILGDLQWGLVPYWAEDPAIGNRMINARAETVATKPSFRSAFRKRRCLIPADGYYEWQKTVGGKQPVYIRIDNGAAFAFAGLYEIWTGPDETKLSTCTIITTTPNDALASIHHRMPVILDEDGWHDWLGGDNADIGALQDMLVPFDPSRTTAYPVSPRVNSPRNDDAGCIASIAA